jgi:hypothetical protein
MGSDTAEQTTEQVARWRQRRRWDIVVGVASMLALGGAFLFDAAGILL